MYGKKHNSFKINTFQKKAANTISTKFTPVKILNIRKSENNCEKKFRNTCQNFYKGKNAFDFTLNSSSNSKNKVKLTNQNVSHILKKNKTIKIKKSIESPSKSIKKQVFKISLLSPIKKHIKFNTDTIKIKYSEKNNKFSNYGKNEKSKKNPNLIINKLKIPPFIDNILHPLTNNTNKATNYTSFTTNDKNNFTSYKNEFKNEKQSEFLNVELGELDNFSDFSLKSLISDKSFEEKEMNPDELCNYYQNIKDTSFLDLNNNKNDVKNNKMCYSDNNLNCEQSFYCNDINEKKDGEDIHKVYNLTTSFKSNLEEWIKFKKTINNKQLNNINKLPTISNSILNYKIQYNGDGISFRKNLLNQ